MELDQILNDLQTSLDVVQSKLNLLKTVQTGKLYEVDILMTRKEAAYFINKSTRQLDRLCDERKIKREYIDGAVRIRRSSLLEYLGVEVRPLASKTKPMSEFDRIFNKYH